MSAWLCAKLQLSNGDLASCREPHAKDERQDFTDQHCSRMSKIYFKKKADCKLALPHCTKSDCLHPICPLIVSLLFLITVCVKFSACNCIIAAAFVALRQARGMIQHCYGTFFFFGFGIARWKPINSGLGKTRSLWCHSSCCQKP